VDLMTVLGFIILVLALLWLFGWWLGQGEDLSRYDAPVDAVAWERFGQDGEPSEAHRRAEHLIREHGAQASGGSRKRMIELSREFMESFPAGRNFDCEFRPVDAGGIPAEWVLAPGANPARRILYIHGGAFIAGSPNSHRTLTSQYAGLTGAAVLAIDYRLMPEHPRRVGIEDCRQAYRWVLENGPDGADPAQCLHVSGDSAGGNLTLMIANWARDQGLRSPDALVALSPLTDSAYASPSLAANVDSDTMLGPLFGKLMKIPRPILHLAFLAENRYRPTDPDVSPLRASLAGLPPTLLQVSEAEMLLDDARRYVNKARAAGSPARLQSWNGLLHVWQIFNPEVPEAMQALERIAAFLQECEAARAA